MRRHTLPILGTLLGLSLVVIAALLFTAQSAQKSQPLAEVNGQVITEAEVEKALGMELAGLQEKIYQMKKEKLDALIEEKLLASEAARRGISVEELLKVEVTEKTGEVTDTEIQALFEANKSRFPGNEEVLRERVIAFLGERRQGERRKVFVTSLRDAAKVETHLPPPEVYRAEINTDGAPTRGPQNAAVTIVKFEDFHCPFCRRVQSTLNELQSRYGERIRIAHIDFPLDSLHPVARKSHEAARCAGEQGHFWEYHDALYRAKPATTEEELAEQARQVGLDLKAFNECYESGRFQAVVRRDVEQGLGLGLTGTPAFFINGRLLSGAQPLQNFVEVIDQELARQP